MSMNGRKVVQHIFLGMELPMAKMAVMVDLVFGSCPIEIHVIQYKGV